MSITETAQKPLYIIIDPIEGDVLKALLPELLLKQSYELKNFEDGLSDQLPEDCTCLVFLSDIQTKQFLSEILGKEIVVGFMPHPKFKMGRLAFGVPARLESAVEDCLSQIAQPIDALFCNDALVLNSVIIGEAFTQTAVSEVAERWKEKLSRFFKLIRDASGQRFHPFSILTKRVNSIETAALGAVIVEHGRCSALTRRLLKDTAANDGMLNVLVLAPRSIIELIRFLLVSLFVKNVETIATSPEFIGYIKTEALSIKSPQPFSLNVDGIQTTVKELELEVRSDSFKIFPGRHLRLQKSIVAERKESFKVSGLPIADARLALISEPIPLIHHASTEEFKDLFHALKTNAIFSESYFVLTILSTLLATIGLFANSTPVIIGAMILAPLMAPIISAGMGVLRLDEYLLANSAKTLAWGVLLALVCSMVLTWLTPLQTLNSEMIARLSPTILDLGVAIISGIAGAYAHARAEVARSLAGVAIAVALVPPLAVAGIGLGWAEFFMFANAFLLFLTNLSGIVLAAALTFLLLGYAPFKRARRGLIFSSLFVIAISIPLVFGFMQLVEEHKIIRSIDGLKYDNVQLREVKVQRGQPILLSARLVSPEPISSEQISQIKARIEVKLQRTVAFEVTTAIVR